MKTSKSKLVISAPRKDTPYANTFDMSFVSADNVQVCGGTGCRDYLQDTIRTFFNNKKRLASDCHNYYPDLGDPDLCTDKLRLLIKLNFTDDDDVAKENIKRAVKMLNILEDFGNIEKTKMKFVKTQKPKNNELSFLLEGSKEYMHNPHLLSLLTLVIRFTYFNRNIKVVNEKSLYNSHLSATRDKGLMTTCHKIIHLILKKREELFEGISLKELFPTGIGYSFHSQGGIQSLCDARSPNTKVNERIKLLKQEDEGIEHAIKIINDIKLIKQRYNFMKENIYEVNWSKKYIMTGSMRVSAKSNDDANSKVSKVLGDLVGSMQLTDEDSVESHISVESHMVEKNSI